MSDAASYLIKFKGTQGTCGKIKAIQIKIGILDGGLTDWRPLSVHANGVIPDPTPTTALGCMHEIEKLNAQLDVYNREVAQAKSLICGIPHGKILIDYYLTNDDFVTWDMIAADYKKTRITILRWRKDALRILDERMLDGGKN